VRRDRAGGDGVSVVWDAEDLAWMSGFNAARLKEPLSVNPNKLRTKVHRAWARGWRYFDTNHRPTLEAERGSGFATTDEAAQQAWLERVTR
jgi:hypothetical protein